jgi:hypothetical protein
LKSQKKVPAFFLVFFWLVYSFPCYQNQTWATKNSNFAPKIRINEHIHNTGTHICTWAAFQSMNKSFLTRRGVLIKQIIWAVWTYQKIAPAEICRLVYRRSP